MWAPRCVFLGRKHQVSSDSQRGHEARKARNHRARGSLGDMEAGEEVPLVGASHVEQKATAPEALSPPSADVNSPPPLPPPTSPGGPQELEEQEPEPRPTEEEPGSPWSGPDELEPVVQDGQRRIRARLSLATGLSWGPFHGSVQTRASSPGQAEPSPALTLLLVDEACWLRTLPQALTEAEANTEIHRKDDALWCRVTKPVPAGGLLSVLLTAKSHSTPGHPVEKEEPAEPTCPAPAHDLQLLPQQAGMASILATAVINKDVFPCKDCGIWYRSERNLQAHLLYYCASRQGTGSPAGAATDEKPKETYSNERICPFPQCRKSCPSASSLEIHMRSHSGERPFVCLICLSAFTTKANCERHLKVHTDTLSGVCHSCGFISTTRDILYSHLVTNHMVCQPGSKGEIYSPGAGHPATKLPPVWAASSSSTRPCTAPWPPRTWAWRPPHRQDWTERPWPRPPTERPERPPRMEAAASPRRPPRASRWRRWRSRRPPPSRAPESLGPRPRRGRRRRAAPPRPGSRPSCPAPRQAPARCPASWAWPGPCSCRSMCSGPTGRPPPRRSWPRCPSWCTAGCSRARARAPAARRPVSSRGPPRALRASSARSPSATSTTTTCTSASTVRAAVRPRTRPPRAGPRRPPARPARPPARPPSPTRRARPRAPERARTGLGARPRPRTARAAGAARAARARVAPWTTRRTTPAARCARPATSASAATRPTPCTSGTTAPRATTRRRADRPHPRDPLGRLRPRPPLPPRPCARADAASSTSCTRPAPRPSRRPATPPRPSRRGPEAEAAPAPPLRARPTPRPTAPST
ncbi:zinc finger protein ZFPM1 isoform X4 [Symphalangus syndactylus]|uniref:zinc finger protein ZFPM1 isoform X4 n=1 Tax=Symphalangus syndactylus TaxID=9590 RepID=UPI00300702D3